MRFATRAFAFCFIPFALVLGFSFWSLQSRVQRSVWEELQLGMRDKQKSMARMRAKNELQVSRILRFASENTTLKAGLQLLNAEPASVDARQTVEDQLRELSSQIGFNLLSIANFKRTPVAWVVREGASIEVPEVAPATGIQGLSEYRGQLYQLVSVPIDQGDENLGYLSVGDRFDLAEYGVPAVLFKNGRMVRTDHIDAPVGLVEAAMARCGVVPECDQSINGSSYLSLRLQDAALGEGYVLRSLQNVDAAAAPVQTVLRGVFLTASIGAVLVAFFVSAGASRTMLRPLADMVSHLRNSEAQGLLEELPADHSRIIEIHDLISTFNRAASAIREGRHGLQAACFEFVGSLAHALDARDRYTAGHSQRVSGIATSISQALGLSAEEQEVIRIGALLHDIGKIGVPDYVLQKPGVLSDAEFALIKQHPTIGCRILEGVQGFSPYLPTVELHHENWDGSGYPYGLSGKAVPLAARIVHVADAWDAMTSDRPYRDGFTHARALAIIQFNAGTQFDPEITEVFSQLMYADVANEAESMLLLSVAIGQQSAPVAVEAVNWDRL
jgi:putative nucleotidyltransferase with HDIG domain